MYFVASVAPVQPTETELADYAFAKAVQDSAPNPHLAWYQGRYVEAENPNKNGVMWASADLAIASVTPMLMPISVMHDPRTSVGLIADTRLLTIEQDQVPRSRIETTLALWKHRYPEVVEEAEANYHAGTLMQSMESVSRYYDCSTCGKSYVRLPDWAEKANWCEHLLGKTGQKSARILRGTTFTGSGLIFGTRGAEGAYSEAHLAPLIEEVAAAYDEAHEQTRTRRTPSKTRRRKVEIADARYEELVAAESRGKAAEARLADVEPKLQSADEALATKTREVEAAEIKAKAAANEAAAEKTKREALEETARSTTLASERTGKLGSKFTAKLPDSVKTRLTEQAKTLSDEEWTARLDELAEMTGVKPDEAATDDDESGTFSREDVARSGLGDQASASNGDPSPSARRSVVAGLIK